MTTVAPPAPAPGAAPSPAAPELEPRVRELGRRIAAGQATAGRSRARALEDRGMELLGARPAAPRGVVPAGRCRARVCGPRDLAAHLASLLGEVSGRSRRSPSARRASRRPVTSEAVGGVAGLAVTGWPTLHRRRRARGRGAGAGAGCGAPAPPRRSTCSARRPSPPPRPTATRAAATRRCAPSRAPPREWPRAPLERLEGMPRVNLSVKVTALTPRVRAEAPELGIADARHRLRGLLRTAREVGAHLHVDMESMDSRELITELVLRAARRARVHATARRPGSSCRPTCATPTSSSTASWRASPARSRSPSGSSRAPTGSTRRSRRASTAGRAGVRGQGRERPQLRTPDAAADRGAAGASASRSPRHNVRSLAHAMALAAGDGDLELQVLRGLGDDLQAALAGMGLRVRTYCPVGDLVAGMAYLVRRLLENTSNDSFLLSRVARRGPRLPARGAVTISSTSRCWSCAVLRCASRSSTRSPRSTRGCRCACR